MIWVATSTSPFSHPLVHHKARPSLLMFENRSLTKSTAVVAAADMTPDGGKEDEDEVETSRAIV